MGNKIWGIINTITLIILIVLIAALGMKISENINIESNIIKDNNATSPEPSSITSITSENNDNDIIRTTKKKDSSDNNASNRGDTGKIYSLRQASSTQIDNVGVMPGTPIAIVTSRDASTVSYERCTIAFSLPGKGGYPWGITAGHCGNVGDKVYTIPVNNEWSSSYFLGTIRYKSEINSENGDGDWAAIRLYDKAPIPQYNNNIPMRLNTNNVAEGTSVCKNGSRTGYSCGIQGDKNVKAILSGTDGSDQTTGYLDEVKKICALPGDSGSPVFSDSGIIGVLSSTGASSEDSKSGVCTAPSSAYYVPIGQVIKQIKEKVPDIIFKRL